MTILDLIALRQAIASGHVNPEYTPFDGDTPRWYCHSEPPCNTCSLSRQCEKVLVGDKWYARLKTLPDFSLSLDELQSKYPELFI